MNDNKSRRRALLGHLPEVLKLCNGRYYALPGTPEEIGLCAFVSAWMDGRTESFTREDCADFLRQLKPCCESLFQDRPEPEETLKVTEKVKALLKEFSDQVTGALSFQNPWSEEHKNLSDQMAIMKEYPELGEYLKRSAKGSTFSDVKKQREEKAQRDALREIKYDAEEHKKNPYRNGANLTELSEFRARVGDQVADWWKREGTLPVSLPWVGQRNLSTMMRMQRENPKLREIVDRSIATAKQWAQDDIEESKATAAQAASRHATAQTLLATK
jgi:hypothetical protein